MANPASYSSRAALASAAGKGQQHEKQKQAGPQLRRKPGKTFLNIRNQPLGTIPTPLPEYQVYLNAMPSLTPTTPASLSASKAAAAAGSQCGRKGVARTPSLPSSSRNTSHNVAEEQLVMRTTSTRRPHHCHRDGPERKAGKQLEKSHPRKRTGRVVSDDDENSRSNKAMSLESSGKSPFPAVVVDDDGSDLSFVCSTSQRLSSTGRI